jgi:hypothetical protein
LIVLVILMIQCLVRLTRKVMNEPGRRAWTTWMLLFVLFMINNYSESVAFKHTDIAWVLLLLGLLYSSQRQPATVWLPEREFRRPETAAATLEQGSARA